MKKKLFLLILIILPCFLMNAQVIDKAQEDKTCTIEGTIYDENGETLPGATVYVKDRVTLGSTSNSDGKFAIKAKMNEILVFSFVGYENVEYLVSGDKKDVEIRFTNVTSIEEVVVVGMGTQRKVSSVAAVSSVDVKDLQVPAPSIANMIGGRVAGIITMQNSGEPGKNLAEFWVRGIGTFGANKSALVLIDGLEGDLNAIDPADVESFTVLKDASATAVYGVRGANGVVLVTTKQGEEGRLMLNVRANFSVSQLRRMPKYLHAYEYAQLTNEAYELRGQPAQYNPIELKVIKDHLDNDLYPDVDWQKETIRPLSFKQAYYASARGGGAIARYFVSLGLSNETGAYKVEKGNPYGQNAGYNTYSFRTNLNIDLTPTTELYFGADAWMDINKRPGIADTDAIWASQARLNPLQVPMMYSNGLLPGLGDGTGMSSYTMINKTGRTSVQNYRNMITIAINQNLEGLTKGLRLTVQGAYNRNGGVTERRFVIPALYRVTGRTNTGVLRYQETLQAQNVTYSNSRTYDRKFHFEGKLLYDRVFGSDHRVGGLVYYYISDQQNYWDFDGHDADHAFTSLNAIPVRYQGVSSRLTYGFRDTYMIDFNFGFTGSENFPKGKQYGFFPSVAVGWVPTGYKFMKNSLPWLDFLKIRASYGTVGNDKIGGRRFPYLTRVTESNVLPWYTVSSKEGIWVSAEGADNLVWENAIKSDIGVEGKLFKEHLTFTVDFFNDQRDGIFQQRVQVPDFVGLVQMPYGNVGRMRSYGSDGNIAYTHEFSKDMSLTVRGNYTYSQNVVQEYEKLYEPYPYMDWTGLPNGVVRGYQCLGFFTDEDDIKYSPTQTFGGVMPGDLKYKDMNGDGKIDVNDQVPIGYKNGFPLLMYGAGAEFRYRDLSIGVLFKGTGKTDYFRNNAGYVPFYGYGETAGNVLEKFADPSVRWIPRQYCIDHDIDPSLAENPNAKIPRLQYAAASGSNNLQTSTFWKNNARYLRLQEVTINYNLKKPWLKKIGITSIDLQLVGNNLYVWDKVKDFDPEQAKDSGLKYPLPAVYSFQLYINL